jgi:hypothetical protein
VITRTHVPAIYIEHTMNNVNNIARLVIGDNVIAYSGGSRYSERLVEDLEERLAGVLRTLMMDSAIRQEEHDRLREEWGRTY